MLKVHNSFSNQTEEFSPITEGKVNMYVCGPTVYDHPHLGHARCYITWDMVYRYLKFLGYDVRYCRNVTDVDDKILAKAKAENSTQQEISQKYYKIFSDSMDKLNILKPDIEPFATKTIGEMIAIVKDLINKGFAYEVDGDVYFRVKKFKDYGKLSKQPIDDLVAGARVEASSKKEDVLDFALWKKDEIDGFKSPWGLGRPGWHIECSAMARKHLAKEIDIHAGGADLIFPHHENEIAQSECANGCRFVKYWLHNGFVTINKEKMSKSLKNFVSIDALLENYDSNTIRFFILTNHYRMPVEFNDMALAGAQAGFKRLKTAYNDGVKYVGEANLLEDIDVPEIEQFKEAMDNDFNTSKALAVLFDLATAANKCKDANDKQGALQAVSALVKLTNVMGFKVEKDELSESELSERLDNIVADFDFLPETDKKLTGNALMERVIAVRNEARSNKNWDVADKIRNLLDSINIILKDNKDGTIWQEK
ncbi:MAG: cysteine--tRNA ligase [Candidatus Gastranaerophilales bacterium]|nr:cysteine--tRNA ligase [Candidatus Gastranaerophilales bacterium]